MKVFLIISKRFLRFLDSVKEQRSFEAIFTKHYVSQKFE
jgi:hypothetical protein